MKNYIGLAVLLLVGGAGCIFGGVGIFLNNQTFLGTAEIIQATVANGGEKGGMGSGIQVSFALKDGSRKTVGLDPQFSHKAGDSVLVAYQPSTPDKVRIYTFWEMNVAPACLLTIGVLLMGASVFTFSAAYPGRRGRRTRVYDNALGIPEELLKDKVVAEAFARDPVFGKQVRVNVQERIEINNPVTGEKQIYNSSDEVPPDIQAKLDAIRDRYKSAKTQPFTFRNESTSEVKTYHSLDEMPPEVRRFFENVGKGEGPSPE